MIHCCYQCEKRKLGCHSICEDYKKEKAELDRINKERYIKNQQSYRPPTKQI